MRQAGLPAFYEEAPSMKITHYFFCMNNQGPKRPIKAVLFLQDDVPEQDTLFYMATVIVCCILLLNFPQTVSSVESRWNDLENCLGILACNHLLYVLCLSLFFKTIFFLSFISRYSQAIVYFTRRKFGAAAQQQSLFTQVTFDTILSFCPPFILFISLFTC